MRYIVLFFPTARIFPKGTLGMYYTKTMHDDDNGAVTPSVWQSVVGDDNIMLSFHGVDFEVGLVTTTHQFCWFMGWIPHKSSKILEQTENQVRRINHSAYSKPEYEHFSHAILHKNYYRQTMSSLKLKK